jgi:hypothetical protein
MSTHVYDNLLIKNKTFVTSVQAASATGITTFTSAGSQSLQIAESGDVTLFGPQHTVYKTLQKIDFVGGKDIGSLSGNMIIPLFSISMLANTQVGFRTHLVLTSNNASIAVFQEYYGVALNTNGTLSCQINQLATSPMIALSPSQVNIIGDASFGVGTSNTLQSLTTTFPLNFGLTITGDQTTTISVQFLVELLGPSSTTISRM